MQNANDERKRKEERDALPDLAGLVGIGLVVLLLLVGTILTGFAISSGGFTALWNTRTFNWQPTPTPRALSLAVTTDLMERQLVATKQLPVQVVGVEPDTVAIAGEGALADDVQLTIAGSIAGILAVNDNPVEQIVVGEGAEGAGIAISKANLIAWYRGELTNEELLATGEEASMPSAAFATVADSRAATAVVLQEASAARTATAEAEAAAEATPEADDSATDGDAEATPTVEDEEAATEDEADAAATDGDTESITLGGDAEIEAAAANLQGTLNALELDGRTFTVRGTDGGLIVGASGDALTDDEREQLARAIGADAAALEASGVERVVLAGGDEAISLPLAQLGALATNESDFTEVLNTGSEVALSEEARGELLTGQASDEAAPADTAATDEDNATTANTGGGTESITLGGSPDVEAAAEELQGTLNTLELDGRTVTVRGTDGGLIVGVSGGPLSDAEREQLARAIGEDADTLAASGVERVVLAGGDAAVSIPTSDLGALATNESDATEVFNNATTVTLPDDVRGELALTEADGTTASGAGDDATGSGNLVTTQAGELDTAALTESVAELAEGGALDMEILLDASGSMAAELAAGSDTRIVAGQTAMNNLITTLEAQNNENLNVGMRIFGHRGSNEDAGRAESCQSTELLVPIEGGTNPPLLREQLAVWQPIGWTPIGLALTEAGNDLAARPAENGRLVVLITDGEESCDADPCAIAATLAEQGIRVDVIGFGLTPETAATLQCIPENTEGVYIDAQDGATLQSSLEAIVNAVNN